MTPIANNGKVSSPRGAEPWPDNLATNDGPVAPLTPVAAVRNAPGKNRFAELLTPNSKLSEPNKALQTPKIQTGMIAGQSLAKPLAATFTRNDPNLPDSRGPWERPIAMDDNNRFQAKPRASGILTNTKQPGNDLGSNTLSNKDTSPDSDAKPLSPPDGTPSKRVWTSRSVTVSDDTPQTMNSRAAPLPGALSAAALDATADHTAPLDSNSQEPAAPEDWRLRLQAMLAAAGGPELFMQQNPSLALLSGRLEYIEPAQIPSVVAQSPLLQQILSAPQSAVALQTPMPFNQNLQMLGLNPQPLNGLGPQAQAIASLGTDIKTPVNIGDILHELGFDVPRVTQEGDLLKNNLTLDGLQDYMQRAERMRASLGQPIEMPLPASLTEPTPTIDTVPLTAVPLSAGPLNQAFEAKKPKIGLPQLPTELPASPDRLPDVEAQLWAQIPNSSLLIPMVAVDDATAAAALPNQTEVNPFDKVGEKSAHAGKSQQLGLLDPQATQSLNPAPTIFSPLPQSRLVSQDPFLAMTAGWDPNSVQTLSKEDTVPIDLSSKAPEPRLLPLRSLDDLLNGHLLQAPDAGIRSAEAPVPKESMSFELTSLQFSPQDARSSGDSKGSDFSGQSQNQSMNQDPSSAFMPNSPAAMSAQKGFAVATPTAAPNPTTNAPAAPTHQAMQHIFDNSSMLIREGGGSIRIDMGSKEMGPLDLALDIRGKTVELRIITHSNQARDALVQELPRLRESLLNHHLNLDKVEIGLSNSSAWSQSSGNGRQGRDQMFESWQDTSTRGPQGIRSENRVYRQVTGIAPDERIPLHKGLIQVRV